jgi:4-hydroxybenzoate polyprenyltransferase
VNVSSIPATIQTWGRMVRFSHSVFALPFAVSGAVLAAVGHGIRARQLVWIVVAMVAARNAAMGFNRLVDQEIDRRNPRTSGRELPSGRLSRPAVWLFTGLLSALFVLASFQLGRLCGALAPVALAVVFGYSYTKRFTWWSHLVLGLALSIAPIGGWLAVRGTLAPAPFFLAAAVLLWVAGFDVIYATQDVAFDRAQGLHSIPARFGIAASLGIARVLHAGTLALLAAVGIAMGLHPIYWAGLGAIAILLVYEHRLVRPDDLSKLGIAFFRMNGVIGVVYLATILAALALGRGGS